MSIELAPDPQFPLPEGVHLRILGRPDIELLVEHLCSLDDSGRHDRFNAATSREWIETYARRCIHPGTLVLAAEHGGKVVGVAELHPLTPEAAECAFSVLKEWRGQGIGEGLFAMIAEAAWSRGLSEIEITTHPANEAMKRLARKFGANLNFNEGDTVGRIALDDLHILDKDGTTTHWVKPSGRKARR